MGKSWKKSLFGSNGGTKLFSLCDVQDRPSVPGTEGKHGLLRCGAERAAATIYEDEGEGGDRGRETRASSRREKANERKTALVGLRTIQPLLQARGGHRNSR